MTRFLGYANVNYYLVDGFDYIFKINGYIPWTGYPEIDWNRYRVFVCTDTTANPNESSLIRFIQDGTYYADGPPPFMGVGQTVLFWKDFRTINSEKARKRTGNVIYALHITVNSFA